MEPTIEEALDNLEVDDDDTEKVDLTEEQLKLIEEEELGGSVEKKPKTELPAGEPDPGRVP